MKYVAVNDAGEIIGRFDSSFHATIPKDAIGISEALWKATLNDTDGVWRLVDGELVKQPLPVILPDYAQLVAEERYRRESTGVLVGGLQIETTRDSQSLIASTGLSAVLDPEYRCNFKTMTAFVEIGAVEIIAIAQAVRAHVQACFDRELALLRLIESGDYRDEMLTEGWPDSSPPAAASDLL